MPKGKVSGNSLTRRSVIQLTAMGTLLSMKPSLAGDRVPYGVAVHLEPFREHPSFKKLLIEHCDVIVPMNALKWASLRWVRDRAEIIPPVRVHRSGSHMIIYEIDELGVLILRVRHHREDWTNEPV